MLFEFPFRKNKNSKFFELILLTKQIIEILHRPNTKVFWSEWDTVQEAIHHMKNLLLQLENRDINAVHALQILFAPTGSLQEVAMSSGWSDEYLALSSESDRLITELL